MELWQMGARELATAISRRDTSSVEVVEAHLERIAQVNPKLNAVTRVLDTARAAAAAADAHQSSGGVLGPLHGVPFTIKENLDCVGSPTTQGLVAFAEAMPPLDAPVVERMKAAGAIPLARTNLPDLGLRVHTDSGLHGLTRNPRNHERTAGGSSGGEAASLASGMSPIGLGNDIGGSLRNPAFCCGVTSLKPSFGRIPSASSLEPMSSPISSQLMAVEGPMARTVADVRLGLELLAGPHPRDPWSLPLPLIGPPVERKVALVPEPAGGSTDPSISASVRRAGDALADLGYEVEEVSPPMIEEAHAVWTEWLGGDLLPLLPLLEMVMSADAMTFLNTTRATSAEPTHASSVQTLVRRHVVARAWSEFQSQWPIIIGPVWCAPAFRHGYDIESADTTADVLSLLRFVTPMNLLGLPSAVTGVGHLDDGMPAAVQIVADRGRDDVSLDVAQALEDVFGPSSTCDPAW